MAQVAFLIAIGLELIWHQRKQLCRQRKTEFSYANGSTVPEIRKNNTQIFTDRASQQILRKI